MPPPLQPSQKQKVPESGLTAADLVHWVAALRGLEQVCFPAKDRWWLEEAGSGPAHVEGPVLGQALVAPMDWARETATASHTRLHTASGAAPVW
jgi:hypothetical protein